MPIRNATAIWEHGLLPGKGKVRLGSGRLERLYTYSSRYEEGPGTNPEELLAAAQASSFSMMLARHLSLAGIIPQRISTTAQVAISLAEGGFKITGMTLFIEAVIPGLAVSSFLSLAEKARATCPVAQALAASKTELHVRLSSKPFDRAELIA